MSVAAASPAPPSAWVQRFAPLIPAGEVLDLACGSGRHSHLLASLGHPVCALDRDGDTLAVLAASAPPGISTFQFDLENGAPWPFAPARFAGIVVTNYLYRPLFAAMLASLAPGGVLIYETFACGNERYGKPSNPDFLLRQGELLDLVRDPAMPGWRVIAFEDGYVATPKPAMVQRLCVMAPGAAPEAAATAFPRII